MLLFSIKRSRSVTNFIGISLLLFLLAFNWIAFGPGERNFTRKTKSSFTKPTVNQVSEPEARGVFGVFAGLLDLLVIYGLAKSGRNKT